MQSNNIAIPQLPARSMAGTLDFFRRLGFHCEIVSPTNDYAIAELGSLEVHFFLHESLVPTESAFGCYFRVHNVDALYAQFSQLGLPRFGIPRLTILENKPWGMREFAIIDENGSLIRVGQVL